MTKMRAPRLSPAASVTNDGYFFIDENFNGELFSLVGGFRRESKKVKHSTHAAA